MFKGTNKVLSLMLAMLMLVGMLPASAMADGKPKATVISGEVVGGEYVFTIPKGAGELVKLDMDDYLKQSIIKEYHKRGRNWNTDSSSTLPLVIKNESGRTYNYEDADFSLDMKAEPPEEYYFIDKKDPYKNGRPSNVPYHSVIRTTNQPIQALFGKSYDKISFEEMAGLEDKIKEHGKAVWPLNSSRVEHQIPSSVNTYGEYALWFYNTFFHTNVSSLLDLPMVYKLNLLGYAHAGQSPELEQGNITLKTSIKKSEVNLNQEFARLEALCAGKVFGTNPNPKPSSKWWAEFSACFVETDPDIIAVAYDVLYGYGLRFSFNSKGSDHDKIFFSRRGAQSEKEDLALIEKFEKDTGELGWKTLCKTKLDAKTLEGASLTTAQQSVRDSIGGLHLLNGKTEKYPNATLSMPGYAIPNALFYTGALAGLGLNVTLKGEAIPNLPQTGDTSNLVVTLVIAVAAAAVVGIVLTKKKKAK